MQKFEPDQLVLVRESEKENWDLARYSYCCAEEGKTHIHHIQGIRWFKDDEILPYSGNEHLLGTTDAPYAEVGTDAGGTGGGETKR
nr:MAG TPA: hypothetical protein [Caudoviricetes sp.]